LVYYFEHDAYYPFVVSDETIPESLAIILSNLDRYEEKEGGNYYLFAPKGFEGQHLAITYCLMLFIEDVVFLKNANYFQEMAIEANLYKVADLQTLKRLVEYALTQGSKDPVATLNRFILTGEFV